MRCLFLVALLATTAGAQAAPGDPGAALTAAQFGAYVTGKTLTWSLGTQTWGTEEYLPNQRVQWATRPGECQIGRWYAEGAQICFAYDGNDSPACWIFRPGSGGLLADLQGPNAPLQLTETGQSDQGLPCPGPDLGV